ncbi:hypothetical protein CRN32_10925 [Vibrio vulnificus]|uniref:hypothetical protein n=1 Tax=Vibrio TaxID=662 RepID=UPI00073F897F|nr:MULTISPECIES: hypothetical protein [Vibrio]EIO4107098.1 hypothetical protein [Vibrio vulnificus]KUH59829.1 hypothetical protein ABK16_22010 [Vibrio parahaemolyticus]MDL1993517.1 hypothetical protein [Vibrio parahaemolyticus]POC54772.1 hypothetical protein CRN32_10925 [Vibrio vulnificus]RZQ82727.1 hypothetical protein D8T27_23280 [Vibrio vulnificus]
MENNYKEFSVEKLSDQFSGTTRTVRRNLLVASSIAIALSVDGIKFGSLFGINLSDNVSSSLAIGAISLIALYELISFIVYGIIDHRSWVIKANSIIHKFQADTLNKISEHTRQTKDQLGYIRGKMTSDDDSVVDAIKSQSGVIDAIVIKADDEITKYVDSVDKLKTRMRVVNWLQLGRIYVVDWGVPLFLGMLSVYNNHVSMLSFVNAVFA